jgi:transcriptional regulator with XRE-family HTH domain
VGRIAEVRSARAEAGYPVTYRELAADLGVSESTLYKVRKGTRSGTKVFARLKRGEDTYQVTVRTRDPREPDKWSYQSVNVLVEREDLRKAGLKNRAFAGPRLKAHPQTEEVVRDALRRRQTKLRREKKGSKPWTRVQVEQAEITSVYRPREPRAIPRELHLTMPFPRIRESEAERAERLIEEAGEE